MFRVSVITPTYKYRAIAVIDSVLAQTYQNVEIIVADNGLADDTLGPLAPYSD